MSVNLIHDISKVMRESAIKEREPGGLVYYSGYGGNVYDWELFFDAMALPYFGMGQYARSALQWFISEIDEKGFVQRIMRPEKLTGGWSNFEDEEHCKPFLFQTALGLMRAGDDPSWFTPEHFATLRRFLDYWLGALDRDGNGLSEWNSGPHSGCDTQFTRIGPWRSCYCEGTDINSILYRELLAAAELADWLGLGEEASKARAQAEKKRQTIHAVLWDEKDGFFYDRDIRDGKQIRVKSGAAFITLWAGVATQEQADILVRQHLTNPDEFWTEYPIASYAQSEPDYGQVYVPPAGSDPQYYLRKGHCNWCGGLWPHWNYLILHGLAKYGYTDVAKDIAARYYRAIDADPGWHEWYNAETGEGCGMHPFVAGATVLGAILPTELKLGYSPMALGSPADRLNLEAIRKELGTLGYTSH